MKRSIAVYSIIAVLVLLVSVAVVGEAQMHGKPPTKTPKGCPTCEACATCEPCATCAPCVTETPEPSNTPTVVATHTSIPPTPTDTATATSTPPATATPTLRPTPTAPATSTSTATPRPTPDGITAFPGAEGFGAESVGGRGGMVIEVTNLNDSGPGSLRQCVEESGARVCVFRIGGTIELESCLRIGNPYITIAGQTAPGGGITLKNNPSYTGDPLRIRTHDVIIRYIRSRPGAPNSSSQLHALQVSGSVSYDVIIDHCSFSWGIDEVASVTTGAQDVTLQWCIFSEGLDCSVHPEGCHSAGPFLYYAGTGYISYHHNLGAHSAIRQPYIKCQYDADIVNNISYNPDGDCMHINGEYGGPLRANFVGNYLKPGPDTSGGCPIEFRGGDVRMYFEDNISPVLRPDSSYPETAVLKGGGTVVQSRNDMPLVTTHSCESASSCQAYSLVLADSGASKYLGTDGTFLDRRDTVDERIVDDVRNGTGRIIDDPSDVGGWPVLAAGTPYADVDHDGMADEWEIVHFGNLDRGSPNDSDSDYDGDGWTDLEEFLNGTDPTQ